MMLSLFSHDCAAAALIFASFCLLAISHDDYSSRKRKGLTQPPALVSRPPVVQFQVPSGRAFPELHRFWPCVTNILPSSFGWKMRPWNDWADHHRPSPKLTVSWLVEKRCLCNLSRVTRHHYSAIEGIHPRSCPSSDWPLANVLGRVRLLPNRCHRQPEYIKYLTGRPRGSNAIAQRAKMQV